MADWPSHHAPGATHPFSYEKQYNMGRPPPDAPDPNTGWGPTRFEYPNTRSTTLSIIPTLLDIGYVHRLIKHVNLVAPNLT